MTDRVLILMWDDNGLEQLHDISAFEEESEAKVFAILSGLEPPDDSWPNIETMRLRALYNTPRNYKIIGIKLPVEFTDEKIEEALLPKHNNDRNLTRKILLTRGIHLH